MSRLEPHNLIRELAKVTKNPVQKEILASLELVDQLTPKQKELANKLYKQLRLELIETQARKIQRKLEKLDSLYINSYILGISESDTHYPKKDLQEMAIQALNSRTLKQHKNYNEMIEAYGRAFLL